MHIPYSWKIWRGFKFGDLAVGVETAKFKSTNIFISAAWGQTAKFNDRQYFRLYGIYQQALCSDQLCSHYCVHLLIGKRSAWAFNRNVLANNPYANIIIVAYSVLVFWISLIILLTSSMDTETAVTSTHCHFNRVVWISLIILLTSSMDTETAVTSTHCHFNRVVWISLII